MDWASFINKTLDTTVSVYENRQLQKHELEKISLQQRAADGKAYIEGQRDALGVQFSNGGFSMTPGMMLLIGAAVVALVVFKD